MSKKRGFFTQLIRHLIQFAAFILFPGLFIMVFSAVRDLLTAFMDGSFSFNGLFPQIILVFMVFLITMLWGRFFCGFLCSFGMIQELIFFFSKRIILKKVQIPKRFDYIMKFLKYVILVLITAGVTGSACRFFVESLGRVWDVGFRKFFSRLLIYTYGGICAAFSNSCRLFVCGAFFLPVSVSAGGVACCSIWKEAL